MGDALRRFLRRPFVFWLAWLAAVVPVVWRQVTTSDAWWHVALGRWMWRYRAAPDLSEWYFTPIRAAVPDLRWTWLGDLAMAAAHATGGASGLQALALGCLWGGSVLLRDLARRTGNTAAWSWPWLVILAVGTYQLQLPRNAVFSLPLLAATFWLLVNRRGRWWLVALAGLWSTLHGSYPLAVVVPALWLAGEAIDEFRDAIPGAWRRLGLSALLVAATIAAVAVANPSARHLLSGPFRKALKAPVQAVVAVIESDDEGAPVRPASPTAARGVKQWFNGLLWASGPGGVRSGDFASPFDRWNYRAVPVAFALALLAAGRLALGTRWRWSWALTLAGLAFLGCTYLRMTGYLALGAVACLIGGPPVGPWPARWGGRLALPACGAVAIAAIGGWALALQGQLGRVLGKATHEFGTGAIPLFDKAATSWVLAEFPAMRTFTTIVTGSYADLLWAGKKPVFTDGFFAPHPVQLWEDYRQALDSGTPARLRERYGIELALVEHARADWNRVFLNSPDWRPAGVGAGAMVYAHRGGTTAGATPKLLTNAAGIERLTPYFRQALATNYFGGLLALILAGEVENARALRLADPAAYAVLAASLSGKQGAVVDKVSQVLDGRIELRPQRQFPP